MSQLLAIRDAVNNFIHYNRKVTYPVLRFILYGAILWGYAVTFGYQENSRIGLGVLLLFLTAAALLFPVSFFYFFVSIVTAAEVYFVSPEMGIAVGLIHIILYLLYLRYDPRLCLVAAVLPLAYLCHLQYLVPLIVGMLFGCAGILPAAFGTAVCYYAHYMEDYKTVLSSGTLGEISNGIIYVLRHMNQDKTMWVTMASFAVVIIVVNYIYHLTLDHVWTTAILAGAVVNILCFLLGSFLAELDIEVLAMTLQTAVAAVLAMAVQFFLRAVDFSRVERVEFSDDEYYYYVKAVPKARVGFRDVRTKKISGRTMEDEDSDQ